MPRVFLAADVVERISVCLRALGKSLTPELAPDGGGGGSALQGHTLMIGAQTQAYDTLTHTKLPQGGHSHSWHHQEIAKVPSDSCHEPADDRSLLALQVIPADCQNSKGAAAA